MLPRCAAIILLLLMGEVVDNVLSQRVSMEFEIPYPAGIMIDRVDGPAGEIYRFGRLQYNAVDFRPHWTPVEIVRNVITPMEAQSVIDRTEAHVAAHGWSGGRHVDYHIRPTKDIVVRNIFSTDEQYEAFMVALQDKLWPEFERVFGIDSSLLHIDDFFITKYDAVSSTENALAPHDDKSPWSFVLALSDDFTGGGTYFVDSQTLYKPPVGAAVIFNGKRTHGAFSITNGTRYIMAGFCEYGNVNRVGNEANRQFMKFYDVNYDGYAGQLGFQTGDLIIGVQSCSVDPETQEIRRQITPVTTSMEDEEWVRVTQSCEILVPQGITRLLVKRWVDPEDI